MGDSYLCSTYSKLRDIVIHTLTEMTIEISIRVHTSDGSKCPSHTRSQDNVQMQYSEQHTTHNNRGFLLPP
jgi:hypothetical protein